jgi:DNA mismatch repair protein MutS
VYRHEVFRDLEAPALIESIRSFARRMQMVRGHLDHASKVRYGHEQGRWLLDAATVYCQAVPALIRELDEATLRSTGMVALRGHLSAYVASDDFGRLAADTTRVRAELAAVRYRLRLQGGKVTVYRHEDEPDYGAEVLATFEKFKQAAATEYRWTVDQWPDMNHVEAAIVDRVALLEPAPFASLDEYRGRYREFIDPTVARFDREVQFYLAYLEHIEPLRRAGLSFCYPVVSDRPGEVHGRGVFDLALAPGLVQERTRVVVNGFELDPPERILVVSGPNQGGKTTFARTVGQVHHLARIGVLVPGTAARVPLVDGIFTHFERQEEVEDLTSKLEDDLLRIHRILETATADSLLILNESFSSTTVEDQLSIGRRVVRRILDRGPLCVMVTFLDELASLDPRTVSMVSTVDPDEPARRTFEIVRRPADGLAYAMAIAEKHRLTYPSVKARIAR